MSAPTPTNTTAAAVHARRAAHHRAGILRVLGAGAALGLGTAIAGAASLLTDPLTRELIRQRMTEHKERP